MKLPLRPFLIAVSLILLVTVAVQLFWSKNLDDMLTGLKTKIYNQDNAENKTWMTIEGEKSGHSYSICTEQEIDVHGEKHLMLAVCGTSETMNSHGSTGSVDFYVLKGDRLKFTVAAQLTGIESGAFGRPGDVTVMRLGAAFYGFALSEGWSGQGITLGTTRIFLPKDNTLKEALSIRTSLDNSGTGACGDDQEMPPCDNLKRKLITDETAPEHAVYPIIVKQSGIYQTQNVDGEFKLSFDKSRWDYDVPKNFDLLPE